MLSHLLGSHHSHDGKFKSPTTSVMEVRPAADSTKSDSDHEPVNESEVFDELTVRQQPAVITPTKRATVTKRRSFFGRVANGVQAFFHDTDEHVKEQHIIMKTKVQKQLGARATSGRILETSHADLVVWINSERMTGVPHKGGTWDRVLIAAQHFVNQINTLQERVAFANGTSGVVYGPCLLMLQLGEENADTLIKAFDLFYSFGLQLAPLLKRMDDFQSADVHDNLGKGYVSLMNIVTDVAIDAYQAVHGLKGPNAIVTLDIFESSEEQIEAFRSRLVRCTQIMWDLALVQQRGSDGKDVGDLRRWLAPADSVLAFLALNNINLAVRPAPNTCGWFSKPLSQFIRGDKHTLLVEGKNGSGKTVLANWTFDRLQRYKNMSTLNFVFSPSINAQATSNAMLKTLLYQLMDTAIGNVGVYKAVKEAYNSRESPEKAEESLWTALEKALQAVDEENNNESIVILLDGLDEINSGSKTTAQRVCQRMGNIVQKLESIRTVQFSEPLGITPGQFTLIEIKDQTFDDVSTLIQRAIEDHAHFKDLSLVEQNQLVDTFASAANGSMLWTSLACSVLRLKTTQSSFNEAYNKLKSSPKTISDVVQKLLGAMQLSAESKLVLSWLFAAERPLTLAEINLLLKVNPESRNLVDTAATFTSIRKAIAPFVVVREGLVSLRHTAVEQAILSIPNSEPTSLHLTERHRELITRLFIYTKACLHDTHRPTLIWIDATAAVQKFRENRLLEYCTRYWAIHLKKSKVKNTLPHELVAVFPKSVTFILLEQYCWNSFARHDAVEMHLMAQRLRSSCFGAERPAVLQSTLICAALLETSGRHAESIEFWAFARQSSRLVLGVQAEVTLACCTNLLRISESLVVKERTVIMTYREETYLLMIEIYQHRYGSQSKEILAIYTALVELYVYIDEEAKATKYYEIIRRITTIICGADSEPDNEVSRHLNVVLRKRKDDVDVDTFDGTLFYGGYINTEEVLTIVHIARILVIITERIEKGEHGRAEELYIELWIRITEHCHYNHTGEWYEQKIRIMLLYATFLHERKRTTEAASILICVWQEYEGHEFSEIESIIVVLNEVALLMKSLSMFTLALSVFQKCHSWYKLRHKEHLTVFKEIEVSITHTSIEISQSKAISISKSSKSAIREVFESSFTSTEVSSTTFQLCESLTTICLKEEQWSEAITHIETIIKKSWSFFFEESIQTLSLTSKYTQETIDLVVRMIECYISINRLEAADYYYLRLFRAIKASCKPNEQLFLKYSKLILAFYEAHGFYHKAITFHQELLVLYREFYSSSHALVIETLYALGDLCRNYQRTHGYWIEYYIEILTVLNSGSAICHERALEALRIVATYYHEDCRYSESLQYFKCLLSTFVKHGKTYKFFETIAIREVFELYFRSLRESRTEISVQISILREYREACIVMFGHAAAITISATFQLAEICSRSEKYQFEAISLYEHVCKHSESTSTTVEKSKTTMRSLYVKQITSTSTTVTKETLEIATTMSYEHYMEMRKTYSCTHELVLTHFRDLILLYSKRSMLELAMKELRSLVAECITSITVVKEMVETARFLVEILRTCGWLKHALDLSRELRIQVVYKVTKNVSLWGFNVASTGRRCFGFIAAFEYHLHDEHGATIADYMAALVAESLYFERFCSQIKSKASFEIVFAMAARLRQTLSKRKRLEYFEFVEIDLIEYFKGLEAVVNKESTQAAVQAFVSLLLEYFSQHSIPSENFVAACGHAAEVRIRLLLSDKGESKHGEALELATCTYTYLMQHEGLDDPSEIGIGFRLALLMADRGANRAQDAATHEKMLSLSRRILSEVFDICDNASISLARLQLADLNDLICLVGDQKDYTRLLSLLTTVWSSREGQNEAWADTTLKDQKLGERLVQAQFAAGANKKAIRLCQDIVYNVRRVYGVRHKLTLSMTNLLASLWINTGLNEIKQNNESMAKFYFRKVIELHVADLKTLVGDEDSGDSGDEDLDSEMASIGSPSIKGVGQKMMPSASISTVDRKAEVKSAHDHVRFLKLAVQRAGGFTKSHEINALTAKVWAEFGAELKMQEAEVLSSKWSLNGFGSGKAESKEDDWSLPKSWSILQA